MCWKCRKSLRKGGLKETRKKGQERRSRKDGVGKEGGEGHNEEELLGVQMFQFFTTNSKRRGMPAVSSIASTTGFGRMPTGRVITGVPAYYTSNSGFLLYQPSFNGTTIDLKQSTNIANATVIRTYTGFQTGWNFVHDKDLDSNVIYKMPEGTRVLYKYVLAKGGTTATQTTLTTYTGATTSVLGACYAPACMWTGTGYGAFIIGGFSQGVLHVLEFNQAKTAITATYTVAYPSGGEVYGTEVIPKQASGFTQHFGIAYTRNTKNVASFVVNMDTRTWSNATSIATYTSGTNGPSNGLGMLYYPPGKAIFTGDPDTTSNRIGMTDTSSARIYVWTVTQSGNALSITYLKQVTMAGSGATPYHLSAAAYTAIV